MHAENTSLVSVLRPQSGARAKESSAPGQKSRVHQSLLIITDVQRQVGRKIVVLSNYGVPRHVPAGCLSLHERPSALSTLRVPPALSLCYSVSSVVQALFFRCRRWH